MAALAASTTGARRSEVCRARTSDVDFQASMVTIREKKKSQGRRTTRRVPLSAPLQSVMEEWMSSKRESKWLFPAEQRVRRNRKHRENEDAVSVDEASYHLEITLVNSKWKVLRGWHVFRHSFCSNCASAGVDQRMIDAWMSHQTEEMRKRYRHLFPDAQQSVINQLFVNG